MTFQQLRYFIACSELLSFKQTANILYTSPSTVTRQIATLEDELGIKLFVRNTHSIFVTDEGWEFYLHAQVALEQLDSFENKLIAIGKKTRKIAPAFIIACYTRDGTFSRVVRAVEQTRPSEQLGKPYRYYFPKPGGMVEAVLNGGCQVGVDTAQMLQKYSSETGTVLFHRCPFRIVVGSTSPLVGLKSISTDDLIKRFGSYDSFLPKQLGDTIDRDTPITCAADLKSLGEYTISLLPRIFPLISNFSPLGDNMLLLPRELTIGYSREVTTVALDDESIATDYMLFWKKDEKDPDLRTFVKLIARCVKFECQQSNANRQMYSIVK